ncbi:MAG: hypothetical protein E7074_05060 [Bacteroidales bacterium]|jgi:hypothetical protein|nr:hypothetical protein [Bacteroidales bacterium]
MKLNKLFTAFMLIATIGMVACNKPPKPDGPGKDDPNTPPVVDSVIATDATVVEVIAVANELAAGAESEEYYRVHGIVSAVQTAPEKLVEYGNCNFTVMDETGSIGCFYINYLNNAKFTDPDQALNIGDTVVVVAKAKNYVNKNTGASTPELTNGFIEKLNRNTYIPEVIDASFADIFALLDELPQGSTTMDAYRVKGVVSAVTTAKDKLVGYGNCNFNITEAGSTSGQEIICYYTNWLDNQKFTNADDIPVVGDTVVVVGPLQNYNGKPELFKGFIEEIARKAPEPIIVDDDSQLDVPAGTITCAEAIAIGKQLNDRAATSEVYYIKGIVVENATYASSLKQYGNMTFYIVDNLSDAERFEAYQVFGLDSASFVDMQQVVPGNVVVLKSKIYRYGEQIETEGAGKAFMYSTTNTFVPDSTSKPVIPEGTQQEFNFAGNCFNQTDTVIVADSHTFTLGEVTLTVSKGASTSKPQVLPNQYRMYKNSNFSLSVPAGKNIKYVAITTAGGDKGADLLSADSGTIAVDSFKDGVWTGQANTITFSNTGQVRINKLLVVYD